MLNHLIKIYARLSFVIFRQFDRDDFGPGRRYVLSYIIRADGQFPMPAVHQYGQLNLIRPALPDHGLNRRPGRSACKDHVIHQDDSFVRNRKRKLGGTDLREGGGLRQIVPIEGDVQRAASDFLAFDFPDRLGNHRRQRDTAALDPATAEKVLKLTRSIVDERRISCLMITHNMHQALEMGNRTLMMAEGRIVLDVEGEERRKMSVDDLLRQFAVNVGKALDNDRILLS